MKLGKLRAVELEERTGLHLAAQVGGQDPEGWTAPPRRYPVRTAATLCPPRV